MIPYKNNFQMAINALTEARSDHYDGVNAIYRLSAYLEMDDSNLEEDYAEYLERNIESLAKLSVRPNRIYICDSKFEIDWYPKGFQMVLTRGQYAGLLLEFEEFLNNIQFPNIYINNGSFGDDPKEIVRSVNNDMVNFFPEFNSRCFGLNENESMDIFTE
ncbi:hypothetical protein [Bacillus vallismortis]|uniref:hypothetical protein n=1 Tax=Bacillus vallismortis TaxID=72361 RepID=UPI002091109A|nr:hypothetical protein [Bacillus vallismortis]MCO4852442.1 hypothetical protein [Bacillus vallismortis]